MALRDAMVHRDAANAEAARGWLWERVRVFHDAARYALLQPLFRWAVALTADRLGPNHSGTATACNNLAQLLQAINRRTAYVSAISVGTSRAPCTTRTFSMASVI
jgi:hypothetical protein